MKFDWKKALTTTAVLAFGTLVAVFVSKNKDAKNGQKLDLVVTERKHPK